MRRHERPKLVIIASKEWRHDPAGPLQSFARDYSDVLDQFQIHATGGTGRTLLATNDEMTFALSDSLRQTLSQDAQLAYLPLAPSSRRKPRERDADLVVHRYGSEGGLVEVAAAVAAGDCVAVIFLLDPSDSLSELPENRALQRICKDRNVRLISNLYSARRWAEDESHQYLDYRHSKSLYNLQSTRHNHLTDIEGNVNVRDGMFVSLPIEDQTVAIIAHDGKKFEMLKFVNEHSDLLARYSRILTTGTTGHTIRLVFADATSWKDALNIAASDLDSDSRIVDLLVTAGEFMMQMDPSNQRYELIDEWIKAVRWRNPDDEPQKKLAQYMERWRSESARSGGVRSALRSAPGLTDKVLPAPSGPRGGDILLANEVLQHRCHVALFFQDPAQSHPHDTDIRLFDRTCHFWSDRQPAHRVYITCVSDETSAAQWAKSITSQRAGHQVVLQERLRQRYGVADVVIVRDCTSEENDSNGKILAREGARYLVNTLYANQRTLKHSRVVVGQGSIMNEIAMCVVANVSDPNRIVPPTATTWLPATGLIPYAYPLRQASSIAMRLADHFGGESRAFRSPFLMDHDGANPTTPDQEILSDIDTANVFLLVVGAWDEDAIAELHGNDRQRVVSRNAVTLLGAALIDEQGKRAVIQKGRLVGMSYDRLSAACTSPSCRVILICGSLRRLPCLRAVLRNAPSWRSLVLVLSEEIAHALEEHPIRT